MTNDTTPAPMGADAWPTDIRTLLPLAARLLEQYAGFMESDRRPMTADEARGLAAALASAAQPNHESGMDHSVTKYVKGVYDYLESTSPAGLAAEAFRLPPSATRAQEALLHAATGNPLGERAEAAREDLGSGQADRGPVAPTLAAAPKAAPAQSASIFALRTTPAAGESPWCGIYSIRADAERDAEAMRHATGRAWDVVPLIESTSAAAPRPNTEAAAHEWRVSPTYGGEICANCGAAKGTRRGSAPCGAVAARAQAKEGASNEPPAP